MRNNYTFQIDSEPSRHRLLLDGQEIGTFATLDAAEAEAARIAKRAVPGATLRFELDFKWTLTDLEIRTATLKCGNGKATQSRSLICHSPRPSDQAPGSGEKEECVCG